MIDFKKRFQETCKTNGWRWTDMVDHAAFQSAVETSLAIMSSNKPFPQDVQTAAAFAWKLDGAKEFVNILLGLLNNQAAVETPDFNLNHRK